MTAWINLIVLILPLFVLLAPVAMMVITLERCQPHQLDQMRWARKWGCVFLAIYLFMVGLYIITVPKLLPLPTYHV